MSRWLREGDPIEWPSAQLTCDEGLCFQGLR